MNKGNKNIFRFFPLIFFFIAGNINPALAEGIKSRADSMNILHYDIHLDIMNFGAKQIKGFTVVSITPKTENINKIGLYLLKLSIDSIICDNKFISNYSYNDTLIQIPLNRILSLEDTVKIKVYYHGQPQLDPSANHWGGFFFTGNYAFNLGVGMESNPHPIGRYWFPCLDDFRSRSSYDFYIRTESSHTSVCNGLLKEVKDNGDSTKTFHWQMLNTIPTYLASVAVSNYYNLTDEYEGIERKIPISIYVNPGDSIKAKASFKNLKSILRIFEEYLGTYKWQRVGYVGVPFYYGAMEHATNITYPNFMIDGTLAYESLYAHELSHHWFGNLVTCTSAEDMWINEGWAAYCEYLYREKLYGIKSSKDNLRTNHRYVMQSLHIVDNGYRAIWGLPTEYTYSNTVYKKGADVVHTLRNYMGDSLFFSSVNQMLGKYAFNNISTEELKDFISEKSELNLNDFFNFWVYNKGFPHFSVDSFKIISKSQFPVSNAFKVEVFIRQRLKGTNVLANSNKIEVTFMSNDRRSFTDTIIFSGESGRKIFNVPFNPDIVMIDKEEKIADATTDNYSTIQAKGITDFPETFFNLIVESLKDSAFVRVEHNWLEPDTLKKQVEEIKRISSSRYWKIDGIFPEGFSAKGKFFFSRLTDGNNAYLDNNLLPNIRSSDSLLLLYRKNTADDWHIIPFTKTGSLTTGYIYADNIKPGEYCFGIGKPYQGIDEKLNPEKAVMNIYPNPSAGKFKIEYNINEDGVINIYDEKGSLVDSIPVSKGHKTINWKADKLKIGIYLMNLVTFDNKISITRSVYKN